MKDQAADILKKAFAVLVALLLLSVAIGIQEKYPHTPLKEKVTFDFNEGFPSFSAKTIRSLSFGYAFAVSSCLWIRFLVQTPPVSMGKNQVSWIFLDLDAITEIDPDFMPVYSRGAIFLSVITQDKIGALKILQRGVKRYPGFWRFHAFLAYHYQYEMDDLRSAAEEYAKAAVLPGAPEYFKALAGTMYTKAGEKGLALKFIESMIENTTEPTLKKRLVEKLEKLKARGQ